MERKNIYFTAVFVSFISLCFLAVAAGALNVLLVSPEDNNVTNVQSVSLTCNASSSNPMSYVELYHNVGGSFSSADNEYLKGGGGGAGNVLLFHFNNDSFIGENGTHVYDWSGSSNSGNASGATYGSTSGKWFGAYDLGGGANEYILVKDSASLDLTTNGTIAFWFKLVGVGDQTFLAKGSDSDDNYNSYAIYLDGGFSIMRVFFGSGSDSQAIWAHSGTISAGSWYHFAMVWNGSRVITYLNGIEDKNVAQDTIPYQSSSDLKVGSGSAGNMNGAMDDLAIYNRALNSSEIFQHFDQNYTEKYNTSASFTVSGLLDGSYIWNCLAYDNETSNWSSSNYTLHVDASTPPTVNSIVLNPNTADDVDPNMNISVTSNVTDTSNVSTVIFQWKEIGDWNNDTMDYKNSTGLYENATIVIDVTGGTYYYRVWSNDTNGNAGYSATKNITAIYDYTWNATPSILGTTSGFISTVKTIGNITINNTGDDTLEFDITDDWPFDVFYNGSENPSPTVAAKGAVEFIVNATFEGQDNDRNITINISASHASETPSPAFRTATGTLNSYTGGPYLSVDIITYPSSVVQSTSGVNLSATIKNIGNETAEDVWFNWSLPSGWTNTSGNTSMYIGNMSSQSATNTSSLVVTVGSSAQSGAVTLCANASGSNVNGSECVIVGVTCSDMDGVCGAGCSYVNDADCSVPGGGPGGGTGATRVGGGATTTVVYEYGISMDTLQRLDMRRGETQAFYVNISNTGENTVISSAMLSVAGHPQTFLEITPAIINGLEASSMKQFGVALTAPNYTRYGRYNLTLTVKGDANIAGKGINTTSVEAVSEMVLFVHSANENETILLFQNAVQDIQEMADSGFYVVDLQVLAEQARSALDEWDYDNAWELSGKIINIKETAFVVNCLLDEIKHGMDEAGFYGIDTPESRKMYSLSLLAFERGDYERAKERADEAVLASSLEVGGRIVSARFLHEYWLVMLGVGIVLVFAVFIARLRIRVVMIKRRLKSLKKEESVIKEMIKDLQSRYFDGSKMGKGEYKRLLMDHEARLAKIKKERARLVSRRVRLIGLGNAAKRLERERNHIMELLKENQVKYFEQASISKAFYKENDRELRAEIAEIEKDIEKAKKVKSNEKQKTYLFLALLVVIAAGSTSVTGAFGQNGRSVGLTGQAGTVMYAADDMATDPKAVADAAMNAATNAITIAESLIGEMQQLGFGITRMNDTLTEARLLLSQGNYLGAESLANYVRILKEKAVEVDGLIDEAETRVYELELSGADATAARSLFNDGIEAFGMEMYEDAESQLVQAVSKADEIEASLSIERARQSAEQENIIGFFRENWTHIAIFIVSVIVAIIIIYKATASRRKRKRLERLEREKRAIENAIKKLQVRYFQEAKGSEKEYVLAMKGYQKRLGRAEKGIRMLRQQVRQVNEPKKSGKTKKPNKPEKPESSEKVKPK